MPDGAIRKHPKSIEYDTVSDSYDLTRGAGKKNVQQLIELLTPVADAAVLDIGCGTGNFLQELDGRTGRLVGLDVSQGMLAQAKAKGINAELVHGDACSLPFEEEVFDAAYCIQVFHHIRDTERQKFLVEAHRVLKSEGRFAMQSCSHEQLLTFWEYHYFPTSLDLDRKRIPDVPAIIDMLSRTGFVDITVHPCPFEGFGRGKPERLLKKEHRDGLSTFALLSEQEIKEGCQKIRNDVRSGKARKIVEAFDRKAEQVGRVSFIRCLKA